MQTIYRCFPGGKFKCLTMSYDDGREEDRRLVEIFNRHGIKGTFHLNSAIAGRPTPVPGPNGQKPTGRVGMDEYRTLYAGHEVSCHTATHPTIERCPMEQVVEQVMQDRRALEKAVGYPVRGLSYPNGSFSDQIKQVLPHLGIRYARVVGNSDGFALARDYFEWKSTCHHNHNLLKLGEQFVGLTKKQYMYLMYVWGHSYEFTNDNNWDLIEKFCEMSGGREDIWYATNIQIVDYMEVFDRLQFAADGSFVYNPSVQSAWLSVGQDIVEVRGGEQAALPA